MLGLKRSLDLIKNNGILDPNRGSGKTTAAALTVISAAMSSPGKEISVYDQSINRKTPDFAESFKIKISMLLRMLKLEHFRFNGDCKSGYTLMYDVFEEYEQELVSTWTQK